MWRLLLVLFYTVAEFSVQAIPNIQTSSDPVPDPQNIGHGMQVINVLNGKHRSGKYQLEIENLKTLLLRKDVADSPVALVSIAGPFRGGKSFLLDFFLRYLGAPRSQQVSGRWMGDEEESLKGFHWRGGSKRDTTGIHMWSEPFHIKTEPTGEEVAVLLMDTQGTFDSKSSLGDSTTIFALSTLLASVQIYNLFRNIDETDLQHLQLFTDYGQKAGGAAFQELMFLIRDWPNSYEYDYGYLGGSQFLSEKLMVESDQIEELRSVREHIYSSFAKVTCFLMPHPGMKVAMKAFSGSLADIDENFKFSLSELVTSLFDPKHLSPKIIGGQKVTGRDLFTYFNQYAQIFNSDNLPDITTILEGTKAASLITTTNAARKEYDGRMQAVDTSRESYTTAAILDKHEEARFRAIQTFQSRIILGTLNGTNEALDKLNKDLDQFLLSYQYNNNIKLRKGIKTARSVYNQTLCDLLGVSYKQAVCAHPLDLEQFHQEALTNTLTTFSSLRVRQINETDEEQIKLKEDLIEEFGTLRSINTNNNNKAVLEAHTLYLTTMTARRDFVEPAMLIKRHDETTALALNHFTSNRNKPTNRTEDYYRSQLLKKIENDYEDLKKNNINPNKILLNTAQQVYNDYVSAQWQPRDYCFHPDALTIILDQANDKAIQEFQRNSVDYEKNIYLDKLLSALLRIKDGLIDTNDYTNIKNVQSAFQVYTDRMDRIKAPTDFSDANVEVVAHSTQHELARSAALKSFRDRRLGRNDYARDKYLVELESKIKAMYKEASSFWAKALALLGLFALIVIAG